MAIQRPLPLAAAVLAAAVLFSLAPGLAAADGPSFDATMLPETRAPTDRLRERLGNQVEEFRVELIEQVLPYWYDTIDRANGGYILADDVSGALVETERRLVTQARMVWGFAHAHLNGLSDEERNYLEAATHGYRYLIDTLRDPEQGGYHWSHDLSGRVLQPVKALYGQAFALYALVEYYRASGDDAALAHALDLFRLVERWARDRMHGGWSEHFHSDWRPVRPGERGDVVGIVGLKSGNAHLHWMEALIELLAVSQDETVAEALEEARRVAATYFYPRRPEQSVEYRQADWGLVDGQDHETISYGHLVEFAWLMIRAEQMLDQRPSWDHFHDLLQFVLQHGYDHRRGGTYYQGIGTRPPYNTEKMWWVQAEMMAALTLGVLRFRRSADVLALERLLDFLRTYQIDPRDGIWLFSLNADGTSRYTVKANVWKAAYHDLRAVLMFVAAFARD